MKEKRYSLAIDIGASSGRHILGWIEDGKIKTEEVYRFFNGADEKDGKLVWNIKRLCNEVLNGLKKAAEIGKTPTTVGIDTWAVDYALLGKDDRLFGEVYAYRDARGKRAAEKVHEIIPFESLYEKTGVQFQPFNTVYQLFDDKTEGRLKMAKSFLMLPDYLSFFLTGVKKQEYTNALSTGLVNGKTHKFDKDILKALGFDERLFGKLSMPGEKVGTFKKEIKEFLGYDAEVVLTATHDTASAVIAAPVKRGEPYVSSGTWSLVGVERKTFSNDEKSRFFNYSNEGGDDYYFRFQKNVTGLWIIQRVREEIAKDYSFASIVDLARKSENDYIFDALSPELLSPESMTETIYEAVGKRLTLGETAYCVFNSLARSYAECIREIQSITGEEYQKLSVIGGGSRNMLLNELTAKYVGLPVYAGPKEATAIGNLLIQFIYCGEIESVESGRETIKKSFDITEVKP